MENTIDIKWVNYIYYLNYLLILPYKFIGESFQDKSWIQDFEADFPKKVSLKILN